MICYLEDGRPKVEALLSVGWKNEGRLIECNQEEGRNNLVAYNVRPIQQLNITGQGR
jgi:hypothetical protein